jgi:tight adherence protein B
MAVGLCLAAFGTVGCYLVIASLVAQGHPRAKAMIVALEVAGFKARPEAIVTLVFGIAAAAWFICSVAFGMSLLIEIVLFPIFTGTALFGLRFFLQFKAGQRRAKFLDQLEMALRLMSSGIRVGLSLPQAMNNITEEMEDPARTEFQRVVSQTRIGTTTADALGDLAERMPGGETVMLARVIRVQTQTGGSLSTILDHLAETIKERRRIARKISALTAEGRMGALVLEGLPIGVGFFIVVLERPMGEALLGTWIGHAVLAWVGLLEFLAVYTLNRMLKVNV